MRYDNDTNSLEFYNVTKELYGEYQVMFNLTDTSEGEALYPLDIIIKPKFKGYLNLT